MRNKFDRELEELNADLIQMGMIIEEAIAKAIASFREQNSELASMVKEDEDKVNELEKKIESKALHILLSEQPVARDLRAISTALKMITDMERISDQALDIAEIASNFDGKIFIEKPNHIGKMAEKCVIMVNKSIDSFVTQDLNTAELVIEADDEIDNYFIKVRDDLVALIREDASNGEQAIDFIMIAKYLERIADHAVNIAEWVIFNITGKHKDQRII